MCPSQAVGLLPGVEHARTMGSGSEKCTGGTHPGGLCQGPGLWDEAPWLFFCGTLPTGNSRSLLHLVDGGDKKASSQATDETGGHVWSSRPVRF